MCWRCEQTYQEVMQPHLRAEVYEYRHPNLPEICLQLPECQVTSRIPYGGPGYQHWPSKIPCLETSLGCYGCHDLYSGCAQICADVRGPSNCSGRYHAGLNVRCLGYWAGYSRDKRPFLRVYGALGTLHDPELGFLGLPWLACMGVMYGQKGGNRVMRDWGHAWAMQWHGRLPVPSACSHFHSDACAPSHMCSRLGQKPRGF